MSLFRSNGRALARLFAVFAALLCGATTVALEGLPDYRYSGTVLLGFLALVYAGFSLLRPRAAFLVFLGLAPLLNAYMFFTGRAPDPRPGAYKHFLWTAVVAGWFLRGAASGDLLARGGRSRRAAGHAPPPLRRLRDRAGEPRAPLRLPAGLLHDDAGRAAGGRVPPRVLRRPGPPAGATGSPPRGAGARRGDGDGRRRGDPPGPAPAPPAVRGVEERGRGARRLDRHGGEQLRLDPRSRTPPVPRLDHAPRARPAPAPRRPARRRSVRRTDRRIGVADGFRPLRLRDRRGLPRPAPAGSLPRLPPGRGGFPLRLPGPERAVPGHGRRRGVAEARLRMWRRLVQVAESNPLFGGGYGWVGGAVGGVSAEGTQWADSTVVHIGVEFGLVGLALFGSAVVVGLVAAWGALRGGRDEEVRALGAGAAGALFGCLAISPVHIPWIPFPAALYAWTLLGVLVGFERFEAPKPTDGGSPAPTPPGRAPSPRSSG